jgi:hypothetical protein
MSIRQLTLGLALLGAFSAAQAAPVARLVCTSNQSSLNINLSHFDLGIADSASLPGSGGGGAGKVTLQPLVLHAALSSFDTLFQQSLTGGHFDTCVLTTQASSGDTIQFHLNVVLVASVAAVATSATAQSPSSAFVDATLVYGSVTVKGPANAADDGGTSPATDKWVRVPDKTADQ